MHPQTIRAVRPATLSFFLIPFTNLSVTRFWMELVNGFFTAIQNNDIDRVKALLDETRGHKNGNLALAQNVSGMGPVSLAASLESGEMVKSPLSS